jgi:hypothetical protein
MSGFEDNEFEILEGSTIKEMYVDDGGWEGGLVIVFNKKEEKGLFILGYTELGEWVYHSQLGNIVFETSDYEPHANRIKYLQKKHLGQ